MILTIAEVSSRMDKLETLVGKMLESQTKTAAILDRNFEFIGEELERLNKSLKAEEGLGVEGGKVEGAE